MPHPTTEEKLEVEVTLLVGDIGLLFRPLEKGVAGACCGVCALEKAGVCALEKAVPDACGVPCQKSEIQI